MRRPRPSIAHVHRQISGVAAERGWSAPSYATTRAIITALDRGLVALAHEGPAAYRDGFELALRREAVAPPRPVSRRSSAGPPAAGSRACRTRSSSSTCCCSRSPRRAPCTATGSAFRACATSTSRSRPTSASPSRSAMTRATSPRSASTTAAASCAARSAPSWPARQSACATCRLPAPPAAALRTQLRARRSLADELFPALNSGLSRAVEAPGERRAASRLRRYRED